MRAMNEKDMRKVYGGKFWKCPFCGKKFWTLVLWGLAKHVNTKHI